MMAITYRLLRHKGAAFGAAVIALVVILAAAASILYPAGPFEMVGGITPRAPKYMQNIGLEWLFRLATEPRRLWRRYLIGNAQFLKIVFCQTLSSIFL